MWLWDDNQNGRMERAGIDQDTDLGPDIFAHDTNEDGVFDSFTDADADTTPADLRTSRWPRSGR